MKIKVWILLIVALNFSCQTRKSNDVRSNLSDPKEFFSEYMRITIPYAPIVGEADSLIFGFSKSATEYDTSWVMLVLKSADGIRCVYNQLLPFESTGLDHFKSDSNQYVFYEGYSTRVPLQDWNEIIAESGLSNYHPKDSVRYTGYIHNVNYTIFYDKKNIVNSKSDEDYLVRLDRLFHEKIINSLIEKRNNPKGAFKTK